MLDVVDKKAVGGCQQKEAFYRHLLLSPLVAAC
jgi:hypothetical protein